MGTRPSFGVRVPPGRTGRYRRALGAVVGAALVAVLSSACSGPGGDGGARQPAVGVSPTEAADPCPAVAATDLGRPLRGEPLARFSVTEPGRYWLTARDFPHGGIFDPQVWRTRTDLGSTDALPTYDEQRSRVSDVDVQVDVVEDTWSGVDLAAGSHWLWSSNGGNVLVKSCDGGEIVDVDPAEPADPTRR